MDFVDRLNTTAFLGKEFLTWLWFRTDAQEGLVNIADGGPAAEIFFCDKLTLSGSGEGAEKVAVRSEDPTGSPEAWMSLRQGKKVEQARLRIVREQQEWTCTVTGESLALSGIKIPALLTQEEDDKLRERLALLDRLEGMLTALFVEFVGLRMDSSAWPDERARMTKWVTEIGQ